MSIGSELAAHPPGFPADAVRACLERVVASPQFVRSHRLTRFLRFTVEASLESRTDGLKERTIACKVYGRRLDYDPRCDPIVRSEAHRLRAKLDAYYARGAVDALARALGAALAPAGRELRGDPARSRGWAAGDLAQARQAFAVWRDSPPRLFDHLIRLSLVVGESAAALAQIAESPYQRNYRWLVHEPLARPFLREPGFRRLLDELHGEWLRNLEELGARLLAAPPPLPTPASVLAG